jgi:hypothetical protein
MGLRRLPVRFQRKAWEAKQHVSGSKFLQGAPDRVKHGAVRVKQKCNGEHRKVEVPAICQHPPKGSAGTVQSQPKRVSMWVTTILLKYFRMHIPPQYVSMSHGI